MRDVLSEFWNDFYEWESVGRIITFGWQKQKYFSVKLAPVLLEQAVLGFVEGDLVDIVFKYVSESECVIFKTCSYFEGTEKEELLEIMEPNFWRLPTADNIEQILRELDHQKLVQEPAFVIEQWSLALVPVRSDPKGIAAVHENLPLTPRMIMRSMTYPSTENAQEKQIVKYASSYLRESDTHHLSSFLRFSTESDLFTGKTITVTFSQIEGFQRRPVAHTCGCYLELPVSYDSYPDFE